jgi:hypothetical protein
VFNGHFVIKTEFQKIKAPEKKESKTIEDELKRKILYDKTKKMLKMVIKNDDKSKIIMHKEKNLNRGQSINYNSQEKKVKKINEAPESSRITDDSYSVYKNFVFNYTKNAKNFLNRSSSGKKIISRNITSPLSTNYTTGNASNSNYSKFDQNINFHSHVETKEFPDMKSAERSVYFKTDSNNFLTNTFSNNNTFNSQRIYSSRDDKSRSLSKEKVCENKNFIFRSYDKSPIFKKLSSNYLTNRSKNQLSTRTQDKSNSKTGKIKNNHSMIKISTSNNFNDPPKIKLNKIIVAENLKKLTQLAEISNASKQKNNHKIEIIKLNHMCNKNKCSDNNELNDSPNIFRQSSPSPSRKPLNLTTSGFNLKNYLQKSKLVKNKKSNIVKNFNNKINSTRDRITESIFYSQKNSK